MHPRQRVAVLKPQIARLDPRSRFARGVLGAWLFNDDGGVRAAPTTENYPERVLDAGPYACHVDEIVGSPDEMLSVDSPWGQGVYFNTGNYGEFRNDWGKFWSGLTAVSSFAIVRRRTAGAVTNVLTAGQLGTSTTKLQFEFTSADKLRYGTRAGSEGLQNVLSVRTFAANQWFAIGGSARVVNGGGVYRLYANGEPISTTGSPLHSYSAYDAGYGTWNCRLGGLDYGQITWANVDIVYAMHWGWELTPEDFASLYADPYQPFWSPEVSRYSDAILGDAPVSYYLVNLTKDGKTTVNNTRAVVCEAANATLALDYAESLFQGDGEWDDAVVTELPPTGATEKYAGSTWRIRISGKPVPSPDKIDVSYTSLPGDTLADVAAGLVAALRGPGGNLSTAGYSGGTLTVAGAAEGLGDRTITVDVTPPGASGPIAYSLGLPYGSFVHEGAAGDALSFGLTDTGLPLLVIAR